MCVYVYVRVSVHCEILLCFFFAFSSSSLKINEKHSIITQTMIKVNKYHAANSMIKNNEKKSIQTWQIKIFYLFLFTHTHFKVIEVVIFIIFFLFFLNYNWILNSMYCFEFYFLYCSGLEIHK